MGYQYKRESLSQHEASALANACATHDERLVAWTLLDTGLRVSELTGLTRQHVDWQQHRVIIYGKGGPYGARSKPRVVPLSAREALTGSGLEIGIERADRTADFASVR